MHLVFSFSASMILKAVSSNFLASNFVLSLEYTIDMSRANTVDSWF